MPYDVLASVLLIVLVIAFVVYLVLASIAGRLTLLRTIIAFSLTIFVISSLLSVGHSKWNRQHQLLSSIRNLNHPRHSLSPYTDEQAMKQIMAASPRNIVIQSEQKNINFNNMYDEHVLINGKNYVITIADYEYPLSWTPFETWDINTVKTV